VASEGKMKVTFKSALKFLSRHDIPNFIGRARFAIVDAPHRGLELDVTRIGVLMPALPKNFDPALYEMTGELELSLEITEKG
jgi:hypothetical protein